MPELSLAGQRVLVTGASSGIGAGMARGFAEAGAAVAGQPLQRRPTPPRQVVGEIGEGRRARPSRRRRRLAARPTSSASSTSAAQHFGGVDILVANAGIQKDARLHRDDPGGLARGPGRRPDGRLPLRAGGGAPVPAPGAGSDALEGAGQGDLHELGPPGDPLGRPRQLRRGQGRREDADGDHGAGARAARRSASTPSRPAPSRPRSTRPPGTTPAAPASF